jgi:hypothetical protein
MRPQPQSTRIRDTAATSTEHYHYAHRTHERITKIQTKVTKVQKVGHPSPHFSNSLNGLARLPNRAPLDLALSILLGSLPNRAPLDLALSILLGSAGRRPRTRVKTCSPCAQGKKVLSLGSICCQPLFVHKLNISGFWGQILESKSLDFYSCLRTHRSWRDPEQRDVCCVGILITGKSLIDSPSNVNEVLRQTNQ